MDTVGQRLIELRRRAGNPTQKEVARAVGCSYRSYQNWEGGKDGKPVRPAYRNAVQLARYFGTTPEYILFGIDADSPDRGEMEALNRKLDTIVELLTTLAGEPALREVLSSEQGSGLADLRALRAPQRSGADDHDQDRRPAPQIAAF